MTLPESSSPRRQSRSSMSSSSTYASSTSTRLDPKNHKHYQPHVHIETPYPMVEHAATWNTPAGESSSESFFDIRKPQHHVFMPRRVPSLPNPIHSVEDHLTEFRFGHAARSAKREAKRLAEHNSKDKSRDGSLRRQSPAQTIFEYEEITEDWSERDAQAWADELKKRETARRTSLDFCGGWSGGWVPGDEQRSQRTD